MNSGDYYLYAALDQLRYNLPLYDDESMQENNIRIMPDERAMPGCGPVFIGLRIADILPNKQSLPKSSQLVSLQASITVRTTPAAVPEVGCEYLIRQDQRINYQASLFHIVKAIYTLLHYNDSYLYKVQERVCEYEGMNVNPVTGVLRFRTLSQPRIVDIPNLTEYSENLEVRQEVGLLQVVTFGDGERLA